MRLHNILKALALKFFCETFTPTVVSGVSLNISHVIGFKIGDLCIIIGSFYTSGVTGTTPIYNVPQKYRPSSFVYGAGTEVSNYGAGYNALWTLTTNGAIYQANTGGTVTNGSFTFAYKLGGVLKSLILWAFQRERWCFI